MTTHFNYSIQNFSMNAKVLTGKSQPVPDFMAPCNHGNLISHEKILGIDNSNLPLENKEDVEAEAKAKEEQLNEKFLLAKLTLKNEHYNLSRYQRSHQEEKMDVKEVQKYIEFNLKNTKKLYAMLISEEDQAVLKGLDSSFWTRTSMLVELKQLSTYARQTAEILYKKLLSRQMCKTKEEIEVYNNHKSEQVQGMIAQDGKSGEQEQNDRHDKIISEQAQDITPQNGKSKNKSKMKNTSNQKKVKVLINKTKKMTSSNQEMLKVVTQKNKSKMKNTTSSIKSKPKLKKRSMGTENWMMDQFL